VLRRGGQLVLGRTVVLGTTTVKLTALQKSGAKSTFTCLASSFS
jgi:hypothetical protein